ncbi:class A beta-lactamase [Candidatus Viadribacter manganicus]|uniref:Beta-lactamase n=1 Tax=Candidatus Viadribacter manganicus TaxID=1759059 RepID=A0A1B1AIV3_9PROT|nr:class A beta-lactamase [Candidatus Viadribacter manganicus]ANP46475.1 hypothetical protein ATE48_11385 [Candidatus Viadribacter manganicus]
MLTRRETLLGAAALGACAPLNPTAAYTPPPNDPRFATIERRIGGRVGVAALNTATGDWIGRRIQERFAMCSTFKWLLAAHMLHFDSHLPDYRDQRMRYTEADLLDYAPVTRANIVNGAGDMSILELCRAAVVVSDNTAANLLLRIADGPPGLTNFIRSTGDGITRLDRIEPELNVVPLGEERDTTTPDAMVRTLQRILLETGAVPETILSGSHRERIIGWMVESPTGRERLRAGIPSSWRVGDKTGTWHGENNATNDVAIAWPPNGAPIVIASYLHGSTVEPAQRNAAHAEIARIIVEQFS